MRFTVPEAASSHFFQNTSEELKKDRQTPRKWNTKTNIPLNSRSLDQIPLSNIYGHE